MTKEENNHKKEMLEIMDRSIGMDLDGINFSVRDECSKKALMEIYFYLIEKYKNQIKTLKTQYEKEMMEFKEKNKNANAKVEIYMNKMSEISCREDKLKDEITTLKKSLMEKDDELYCIYHNICFKIEEWDMEEINKKREALLKKIKAREGK